MAKLITPEMALSDQLKLSGMLDDKTLVKNDSGDANINGENVNDEDTIYAPYTFSEIEENIGTITSLESRITDLLYLIDDVKQARGMNQSFAMEACKILPEFGGVSIGHYSKDTTATRFKVALEEMNKGIWALIAAAVVALAAIIYKFIKWLFGESADSSGVKRNNYTQQDILAIINKVEESIPLFKDIENARYPRMDASTLNPDNVTITKVTKPSGDMSDETFANIVTNVFLNDSTDISVVAKYLYESDPLIHDILERGAYYNCMHGSAVLGKQSAIKAKLTDIIKFVDKMIDDRTINTVIKSVNNKYEDEMVKKFPVQYKILFNDRPVELYIILKLIDDAKKALTRERQLKQKPLHPVEVYTRYLRAAKDSNVEFLFRSLDSLKDTVEELAKKLEAAAVTLNTITINANAEANTALINHARLVKQVISSANQEFDQVRRLMKDMSDYINLIGKIGSGLINRFSPEFIKVIEKEVKAGNCVIPNDIKEKHKQLKAIKFKKES